eukprot:2777324-Pleurochrysis_carterae.AAC.1
MVDFLGFLGHKHNSLRYLPLDIIGTLQLKLTLSGNSVMLLKQRGRSMTATAEPNATVAPASQNLSFTLED